jgi:outer membrane protein OmpA-like peptidoglycan-associated protein/tetratricopeptide (TPR) repeat protein
MRYFILTLFSVLYFFAAFAQEPTFTGTKNRKASKYFGDGLLAYTSMEYTKSMQNLKRAVDEDPNFIDAWMLIADIREQNDQFQEAIDIYKKVIIINKDFQIPYYKLAYAAIKAGEYEVSLNYINTYNLLKGDQIDKAKVDRVKATAEFGIEALKHPVPFDPKNLGTAINTPLNEYFPGVTADEQTLIYTRLDKGQNEEFYISKKGKEGWSRGENMGYPVNTPQNEGTISLSSDGQYIFYTGCNRPEGEGSCDIYFSALDGDVWREPRNLGFPINTHSWESQPSLSFDGKTIYFSSNRPGGYGESDIWYSIYSKGRWSAPQNMGPTINTAGSEQVPFIAKDDQTLYFNSDGHIGMGGNDLFVVRKQPDGRWGKPMNMGYPINTQTDEVCFSLSANGKDAYIASERAGGQGGLDIYMFELYEAARPNKTGYIKGFVYDSKSLKKLKAKIELIDLETGKTFIEVVSNRVTGEFLACLQGNKNYALNVSSDGYLFYSENFSLKNQSSSEPLVLNVPLNPILAGERVVLKNVFFDVDKFTLRDESKIELDKLVAFLKLNNTVRIELSGHTDNTGDKARNSVLSANRAKAVYTYLIQNGIEDFRLSYKGYADAQPIADNKTEAGRQQNRRTEFKITSK